MNIIIGLTLTLFMSSVFAAPEGCEEIPKEAVQLCWTGSGNLTSVTKLSPDSKTEKLNLTSHQIHKIAKNTFASLKTLTDLDLSYNGISYIEPGAFDGLSELKEINLINNTFRPLPGIFNNIPKLEELWLVSAFSDDVSQLSAGLFDGLPKLTVLNLKENKLKHISIGVFQTLTALKYLDLSGNKIQTIMPGTFGGLHLDTLVLHRNPIKIIKTDTFNGLSTSSILFLDFNAITELEPRAFNGLTTKMLGLRCNNLTEIKSEVFQGLTCKTIYLHGNQITKIARGAFGNVSEEVELSGNPIAAATSKTELGLPESVNLGLVPKPGLCCN